MNYLYEKDHQIVFQNAQRDMLTMPNLTALYELFQTTQEEAVKERIQAIFERPFGKVLVAEIMIDMTNEHIIERLHTGDICKTLGHVDNYNIIMANEVERVKMAHTGDFDKDCFAVFPYGIVVEESKFPGYMNTTCEMKVALVK